LSRIASTAVGSAGLRLLGSGSGSFTCIIATSIGVVALNGTAPVKSW